MSNRYPHCDHFASYTVCTLKIIKINSFKRVQHDLLHGKWEVILNAISTDDTQWNCFPKYDLVIIELKCVVVLRPMCKYSRHHCWSGHENGNRFPRWPVNICWVISQLIDQPAEKQRERERCRCSWPEPEDIKPKTQANSTRAQAEWRTASHR